MPRKPFQEYEPGFDPLGDAKEFLSRVGSTPEAPPPPDVSPRPELKPDDSLWGKVKRVAGWSPLPEDVGDQFANAVDNPRDRGEGLGAMLKSGLAGAGKGFLDTLRQTATPAGLSTLGNPTSRVGKLLAGSGSAVFMGQGAELAADENSDAGEKAQGLLGVLMGGAGLHGAVKRTPPAARNINEGRFSKPYSDADRFNGEPTPPPPPGPTRHPNDLFDTPEYKSGVVPVASPELPPSGTITPEQWGDWGGAEKNLPTLGLDETGSTVSQSPLAKLLKPRISAATVAAAQKSGRPILDSPETAIDARAFESGKGSYGAGPDEAAQAQLLHRELTHMDDRYNYLTADEGPSAPPRAPVAEPAPPSDLMSMLRASVADQEAKGLAAPPGREGHFTLPEPKAKLTDQRLDEMLAQTDARATERRNRVEGNAPQRRASDRPIVEPKPEDLGTIAPERGGDPLPNVNERDAFQAEYGPVDLLSNERGEVNFGPGLTKAKEGLHDILNPTPETKKRWGAAAQTHQAGSLLFSPLTVGRIAASNTVASLLKATEHAVDQRSVAPIRNLLGELLNVKQMGRDAVEAFKHPDTKHNRFDEGTELPTKGLRGLLSIGSRAVGAADTPFRNAMERAGFSTEDALSVTQQRHPITKTGKALLQAQQSTPTTRLAIPFAKTGINMFEQGVYEPAQSLKKILSGEGEGHDIVKVLFAAGAVAGGYGLADNIDTLPSWAQKLAMASTGQYNVPAAIAYAAAHGPDGVKSALTALQRNIPMAEGFNPDPSALVGRVIPRVTNPDYWTGDKRETHGELEQIQAQIPGLAQLLKVKPAGRAKRATHASR